MATFYSQEEMQGVMGWDTAIENDGQDFSPLPEGDYIFQVTNFERAQHNGSAKIPPCPRADLTLTVYGENGKTARVTERIILYRSMEWKISAFFRCIGQKKHGEVLVPDWSKVQGATGCAHFGIREYTGQDGKTHQVNQLDRFIDADPSNPAKPPMPSADSFTSIPDGAAEETPFK